MTSFPFGYAYRNIFTYEYPVCQICIVPSVLVRKVEQIWFRSPLTDDCYKYVIRMKRRFFLVFCVCGGINESDWLISFSAAVAVGCKARQHTSRFAVASLFFCLRPSPSDATRARRSERKLLKTTPKLLLAPSFLFTMAVAPAEIKLFGKWSYDDVEVSATNAARPPAVSCPSSPNVDDGDAVTL